MATIDGLNGHTGRLRAAFAASGFTQASFAARLEVSQSTVSMWLAGDRQPDRTMTRRIAALLDVAPTWLDYGVGQGPREDLAALRAAYREDVAWIFRPEQPDGSRDFGNANIFSFSPTIGTFVREVLQNVSDAAAGGPARASFTVRRLRGADLEAFLAALRWDEFRPHLEASVRSGQQVGSALDEGLRAVDSGELVLLEVADAGTTGLLGPDVGVGNFAALCRNNLDSNKGSGEAGGSYGLGKAVFWRMSSLSTVLFLSDLVEPAPDSGRQFGRFIGRTELVWHQAGGASFAGPGWLGARDPALPDRPLSYWENAALATDLHLAREGDDPGTSILVVGFRDPSADEDRSPVGIAEQIEAAVAQHFWPALAHGVLGVTVGVAEGREVTRRAAVDVSALSPEFSELLDAHRRDQVAEGLREPGDVVRIPVLLDVPECLATGSEHPAFQHTAYLLVRRSEEVDASRTAGVGQFFRGTGMVVFEVDFNRVVVGAQPFHAAVLCGTAAGDSVDDLRAERFLRTAEPPAHNAWELTEKAHREYARGTGAALGRFRERVRTALRDALVPAVENRPDGPRDLAALFKLGEPAQPERAPRLIVDSARLSDSGSWVVEATIRVPRPDKRIVGRPVLVFEGETGSGSRASWALTPIKDCDVQGDAIVIAPGKRTVRFRAVSDPTTHPVPATRASVRVDFKAIREVAS